MPKTNKTTTPNANVSAVMEAFMHGRSILRTAENTGLSRITITAWKLGQTPDPGVLLYHYFTGKPDGVKLALKLLTLTRPDIVRKLPALDTVLESIHETAI